MDYSKEQKVIRVLYPLLIPAVRLAASASLPLKELKQLIELAYYQEARRRRLKLKELTSLLSVSMAKVGLLSRQLKEHFSRPESERSLPKRICALLWGGPLSEARMGQVLDDVDPEDLSQTIKELVDEHQVEIEPGRTVLRYRLAAQQFRVAHDFWMARIDGLSNFMRAVAQTVEGRFITDDEHAFARQLSFRIKAEQVGEFERLYREQLFPLVTRLDAEAQDDPRSLPLTLTIAWVVDKDTLMEEEEQPPEAP